MNTNLLTRLVFAVVVAALALLNFNCSLFMVRDEIEFDCFPTSVDFQQWMMKEYPAEVKVLESGSAADKALAKEYGADKFYSALYEHKEEVAVIKFDVWHCMKPIDAWALAGRFGLNNEAVNDDNIWSSPTFACSAKGNLIFRISSNTEYMISQAELKKAVLFAKNKVKAQDFKTTFIPKEIENVQFFHIGNGFFSGYRDVYTGNIAIQKEKVDIFWHVAADDQSALAEYTRFMERTQGVTVTDYSGEKKVFFKDLHGYTAVIHKNKYIGGAVGRVTSKQALMDAVYLIDLLTGKEPKKRD